MSALYNNPQQMIQPDKTAKKTKTKRDHACFVFYCAKYSQETERKATVRKSKKAEAANKKQTRNCQNWAAAIAIGHRAAAEICYKSYVITAAM